jgi:hypothetical protein
MGWLGDTEPDFIVLEGWQNRGRHARVVSPEYIGVVRLYVESYRVPHVLQWPEQKEWWTNDKLHAIGLYEPGMPHAMDALRHILYWVTFERKDYYWVNRLRQHHQESG